MIAARLSLRHHNSVNSIKTAIACMFVSLLGACSGAPPVRSMDVRSAPTPPITLSPDGKSATTRLSVLTYNIEGLGWPARKGRAQELREIAERLMRKRVGGGGPDVILFQEMFSAAAKRAVRETGYPAIISGPRRLARAKGVTSERLPGKARAKRGEIGIRLLGSGLAVASRYPLGDAEMHAYGRHSCAGLDCLANKGLVRVVLHLPGVPVPVEIYNTHMNSQGASKAPLARNLAAHDRQSFEASQFIAEHHESDRPLIFGGDFNMRHSEARFSIFSRYLTLDLVHRVCTEPSSGCDVRMSWDGDEPWMDTQDLQLFRPGDRIGIRPVRVEAMFDGADDPRLSDHDGFLVTYELRWPLPL